MAQKQKRPSQPLTASSSESEEDELPSSQQHHEEEEEDDDEEEASSEDQEEDEDDDDEDEDEDQPPSQPASKIPPPNSTPKPTASSETETETETDSEPDQPASAPSAKVKPQTPKSKAQASASAASRSTVKRPADNNSHVSDPKPDPKRAKKKGTDSASVDEAEEDGKKSGGDELKKAFQRFFSEEDEIAILKGLMEFTSKTGSDPYKNSNDFHDFLKKSQSLRADASTNQLKQKIRRLKGKFDNNASKVKNGEAPKFTKPHEQKSFELSKKIWGNTGGGGDNSGVTVAEKAKNNNGKGAKSPKKDTKSKPKRELKYELQSEMVAVDSKEAGKMNIDEKIDPTSSHLLEVIRLDKGICMYGLNEDVVKRGLELMGASKRAELEKQWKELQVAELELYVKRAELVANQATLILEAYKSLDN